MEQLEYHEAANIFPLDEEHLDELAEDIRKQGLLHPIEMFGDKILDGRRRWLACQRAKVKPTMVKVNPDDPVAYVLSLNLHLRHLTVSQRAMVAARARAMYEKAAKERMSEGGKEAGRGRPKKGKENSSYPKSGGQSRDQIGAAVGVSGNTIDKARRVQEAKMPELVKAVEDGALSINKADEVARLPQEERSAALQEAMKPRAASPRTVGKNGNTKEEDDLPEGVSRGVGVTKANEAVDCLRRIPKNDRLRKRGFQIVTDWIKRNK